MRALVVFCMVAGCGGGGFSGDDRATDGGPPPDGGPIESDPVLPTDASWPALGPCRPGWREVADPDVPEIVTCDPWPESGPEDCGAGEAHFPGGAGCEVVGRPCPAGDFAEDVPLAAAVLYVLAGAPAGGDGTMGAPFATITEATGAANDGTVIAISKGTFDENVQVDAGVTLWGACTAETTITSSDHSTGFGAVTMRRTGSVVKNLTVSGERIGVMVNSAARPATLESVIVAGTSSFGIVTQDLSELEAEDLVVRDNRAPADQTTAGYGLLLDGASTVTIARAAFERNTAIGILLDEPGASLTLVDAAVRDTLERRSDRQAGIGIAVQGGGHVELTGVALRSNRSDGLRIEGDATSLDATDLVVEDTLPSADSGDVGVGVNVFAGAEARIARATIEGSRLCGACAYEAGTILGLTDVVLRDTVVQESDGDGGYGLEAHDGALVELAGVAMERNAWIAFSVVGPVTQVLASDVSIADTRLAGAENVGVGLSVFGGGSVDLDRARLERNLGSAISLGDSSTLFHASDLVVRDNEARETDGEGGEGIQALGGAAIELERALFEGNRVAGILLVEPDTSLVATDITIRGTRSRLSDSAKGFGLDIYGGASAMLHGALVLGNRNAGIIVAYAGTRLEGTNVEVRDTQTEEAGGLYGEGLEVIGGASVDLAGAVFSGNHRGGVEAFEPGTSVVLTDLVIDSTLPRECIVTGCAAGGSGLIAMTEAHVEASNFRISDNFECGVQIASGATMDLRSGEVSRNAIGANVQSADFDVSRIRTDVSYRDNDVVLDAASLPLPDAAQNFEQ